MNILVATDLTVRSEPALDRAILLAGELHGKVTLAQVVDDALPKALLDQSISRAEDTLAEQLRKCGTGRIETGLKVIAGDPRRDVARLADVQRSDLIVLGQHLNGRQSPRSFKNTTAGAILSSTVKAVLVVTGEARESYRSTIVGIDFSIFAVAALRQAIRFAPRSELHLVHAYHVPFSGFLGGESSGEEIAYTERLQLDAFLQAEMAHLAQRADESVNRIRTRLEEGHPVDVLRRACQRLAGDLIVIATHSRGSISRAIFGSVASDLLSSMPCDVLVIKPYDDPPAASMT